MKINPVRDVNFTAGKTRILSDFDGTFMPKEFNHDCICNNNPRVDGRAFSAYFSEFDTFLKEGGEDKKNELTISTGRNLPEFNYYMRKIRERGLRTPVPDRLITVNGGDEFVSKANKDFFDSVKDDMFKTKDLQEPNLRLSKYIISYDPKKVVRKVKETLFGLRGKDAVPPMIFEPATHQGMYGYKENMTLQEELERHSCITNYVSMSQDGGHQIRLTAANGSPYLEELEKIPDILREEGFVIYSKVRKKDGETIVNSVDVDGERNWGFGTSVGIKPATRGRVSVLDKFHHAKIMADEIREKDLNDLIIVAGDGKNDLPMLNLSHYVDDMKHTSDFSQAKFRDEVQNLPVRAIFVRNSTSLDKVIEKYEKYFNFDGKKRFIVVDKNDPKRPHTLLEAIKLAKEEYKEENTTYKENQ